MVTLQAKINVFLYFSFYVKINWRPTKKAKVIILNPIKKKLATMPYYFILIGLEASLDDHTMQKMILHLAHIVVKTQ